MEHLDWTHLHATTVLLHNFSTQSGNLIKQWNNCCLISVLFHASLCVSWPSRDSGTVPSRPPASRPSRTLMSDVLWRGSSQGSCSCPGCPADPPAPQPAASSPPGAWGVWPATTRPCEWIMLYVVVSVYSKNTILFCSSFFPKVTKST